jgi:hypothetical protein
MSYNTEFTTITTQDMDWAHKLGIKLVQPICPINRLKKYLVEKSTDVFIKDKICKSCYKYVNILNQSSDTLKFWTSYGICGNCQETIKKLNHPDILEN